jgi:hypothetical protein
MFKRLIPSILLSSLAFAGSGEPAAATPAAISSPDAVLARHFAAGSDSTAWSVETVDIQASIPKLAEHGRLRAIRRLLPFGHPEYQVLAVDGPRTVRQQVISRYLSADMRATSLAPESVAITPANYRFRYQASISDGTTLTYIYEITPRKKRAGLIRGQIWIDAATGQTVRQTGYLVRSPSVFLRRVNVTRDVALRDGIAYAKTTRLEIDTRLIGVAELTIIERPYTSECCGTDATGVGATANPASSN